MDLKENETPGVAIIDRKHLLWLASVLVGGVIIGALVSGAYFGLKTKKIKGEYDRQITKMKEESSAMVEKSGVPFPPKIPVPQEVFNISGTVEKVEGNNITVKAFFFGESKYYKVKAGNETKITKREMIQNPPEPEEGKPFNPFKDSDGKLSDIMEKDAITAEAGDNIKDKTEFEAKTITIQILACHKD